TANIADSAVTTAKLADNSVTSAKIVDGTIATADMADQSITAAKIANNAITDAQVAAGANIAQSKIANLTSDLSGKVSRTGDTMSGDLQIGGASASTFSTSGYVTLANLGSAP